MCVNRHLKALVSQHNQGETLQPQNVWTDTLIQICYNILVDVWYFIHQLVPTHPWGKSCPFPHAPSECEWAQNDVFWGSGSLSMVSHCQFARMHWVARIFDGGKRKPMQHVGFFSFAVWTRSLHTQIRQGKFGIFVTRWRYLSSASPRSLPACPLWTYQSRQQ